MNKYSINGKTFGGDRDCCCCFCYGFCCFQNDFTQPVFFLYLNCSQQHGREKQLLLEEINDFMKLATTVLLFYQSGSVYIRDSQLRVLKSIHTRFQASFSLLTEGSSFVSLPSPLLEINHDSIKCNLVKLLANKRPQLWPNYGKSLISFSQPIPSKQNQAYEFK